MTEVRFYHLQRQSLEEALPKLIAKVCEMELRAVIKAPNDETVILLDKALWEQEPSSFVPHDVAGCSHADVQSVYLTTGDENPASATIQVIVNAADSEKMGDYDRCLYMFDGRDEKIVGAARAAWKAIKEKNWEMSYWQQKELGGWEKKA